MAGSQPVVQASDGERMTLVALQTPLPSLGFVRLE